MPEPAAGVDGACGPGAVEVDELWSVEDPEALDELEVLGELDVVDGCGATVVAAPTLEIAMKRSPQNCFSTTKA